MQYYNKDIQEKCPQLYEYFKSGITDETKNISHCLLFYGNDIQLQCELALEVARLLNCTENKDINCTCNNCKWIREQTHPAVKIYTRLDFRESESSTEEDGGSKSKKNITVEQAQTIIKELSVSGYYHRIYIFCDRDENGNMLPLNKINFPEKTSNALLKTFEEPPSNTTFIFLTKDTTDLISTVVSRSQCFFVPSAQEFYSDYSLVENLMNKYLIINQDNVFDFENELLNIISENDAKTVFKQIQSYLLETIKSNSTNQEYFYNQLKKLHSVEDALLQISITPAMDITTVVENLSFKLIL